ncbi:MAG: hypothetical protein ACMUIS_08965 [bacterium]
MPFLALLVLILVLKFLLPLCGFVTVIGPGRRVDICYPEDQSAVPTEFHLVGVSAYWLFGLGDHSPGFI